MNTLHHYIGLLGSMLVIMSIPLVWLRQPKVGRKVVTISLFTTLAIAVLTIYTLPIMAYLRGIIGNLSIPSMFFLTIFIAQAYTGRQYIIRFEFLRLRRLVVAAGLVLYPFALGLTMWDSYASGYGSLGMFIGLAVLFMCLIIGQSWLILSAVLLSTCAYLLGMMESTNLWDYLLDLWLFLFMLFSALTDTIRRLMMKSAGAHSQ